MDRQQENPQVETIQPDHCRGAGMGNPRKFQQLLEEESRKSQGMPIMGPHDA